MVLKFWATQVEYTNVELVLLALYPFHTKSHWHDMQLHLPRRQEKLLRLPPILSKRPAIL